MSSTEQQAGMGCGGCIVLLLVIGAIVAAAMSIAALIDPFSWMPPIREVFADCPRAVEVDGSCDLADRYPGFWLHVLVKLAYSAAAVVLLVLGGWMMSVLAEYAMHLIGNIPNYL